MIRERLELIDPLEAAAKYLPEMKREGVDVIVALTHLNFARTARWRSAFPKSTSSSAGTSTSPSPPVRTAR